MTDAINTATMIDRWPGLSWVDRALLKSACSTRGKWAGSLRASCPTGGKEPGAWAAWQSIVGYVAPGRTSMYSLMMMSDTERLAYERAEIALKGMGPAGMPLWWWFRMVEPAFRWNLAANRIDRDAALEVLTDWLNSSKE